MFRVRKAGQNPYVIGHRGAKAYAPENTMMSFQKGLACGANLVECDVHLSRDGHLIVIHDERVDRTTDGSGFIQDMDLSQIKELDAGKGERILTLDELLSWINTQPELGIVVELKKGSKAPLECPDGGLEVPGVQRIVQASVEAIQAHQLTDRALVISFNHLWIGEVKKLAPEIATGALYHGNQSTPEEIIRTALSLKADSIWPPIGLVRPDWVKQAHQNNFGVYTWTVNTASDLHRALEADVDGIGSDLPDTIRESLR